MKRLLTILSVILIANSYSYAQANRTIPTYTGERIVRTYPVPAIDHINFEPIKNTTTSYTLVIYNFLGRKMFEKQNFNQKTIVTLDEFSRGVYIYHLSDVSGRLVESGKFQVSK